MNPFVWYELLTPDAEASRAFYGHVAGWTAEVTHIAGPPYTIFSAGGARAAGMMEMAHLPSETANVPPCWTGFVGVSDVDATAAEATRLGGSVALSPRDLPNVGRFAVIHDPQGAALALFQPASGQAGAEPPLNTPGRFGWHELAATDWQAVFPFYETMFGWRKTTEHDMGEMGTYQIFSIGENEMGGMFSRPAGMPGPFWLYYINVQDIDGAVARVRSGSPGGAAGEVVMGPRQVPGGTWIAQCRDPQGAMFAMASSGS